MIWANDDEDAALRPFDDFDRVMAGLPRREPSEWATWEPRHISWNVSKRQSKIAAALATEVGLVAAPEPKEDSFVFMDTRTRVPYHRLVIRHDAHDTFGAIRSAPNAGRSRVLDFEDAMSAIHKEIRAMDARCQGLPACHDDHEPGVALYCTW